MDDKERALKDMQESLEFQVRRKQQIHEAVPIVNGGASTEESGTQMDTLRMNWLEETIRVCPHMRITFNDDPDMEDDNGQIPLGYSIRIDGCEPLDISSSTLRKVIDGAMHELDRTARETSTVAQDE